MRPEESIGRPGTGVTDGCGSPCVCWELSLYPLEGQPVLLITESYLQLIFFFLKISFIFVFMCVLPVCVCTMCAPHAHGGQKAAPDPLELELELSATT